MKNYIILFSLISMMASSCSDDIEVVDVPFSAESLTINAGQSVNFIVGSGADASSIYSGLPGFNFEKSRINLVELKGYDEAYLKANLVAERIPGLKEYLYRVPNSNVIPSGITAIGTDIKLYEGKLVTWDVSNITQSTYLQFDIKGDGTEHIITIKPDNAVLPEMLRYKNSNLAGLGALNTIANNSFAPFCSFPDGFTQASQTGQSVRFGVQTVIAGIPSRIDYQTLTVRELLDNLNINIGPQIIDWLAKNPTASAAGGIEELRFIVNADNPLVTDDDGPLLDYKGKMYIQEIRLGSGDNMVKAFDKGIALPYIFSGKTHTQTITYPTKGTYTATLVSTFVGRKTYSGDGYKTGRADEVLLSEYPTERQIKTLTVTVN